MFQRKNIEEKLLQTVKQVLKQEFDKIEVEAANIRISDVKELAHLVRQARKSQQLTIIDLANLTGVSKDVIHKIEKGDPSVVFEKLLSVIDALGIKLWLQK